MKINAKIIMFAIFGLVFIFISLGINMFSISKIENTNQEIMGGAAYQIMISERIIAHERFVRKVQSAIDGRAEKLEVILDAKECSSTALLEKAMNDKVTSQEQKKAYESALEIHRKIHQQAFEINEMLQGKKYEEVSTYFREVLLKTFDGLVTIFDKINEEAKARIDRLTNERKQYTAGIQLFWIIFPTMASIVAIAYTFFLLKGIRNVTEHVVASIISIAKMTSGVSVGNKNLSNRTNDQAASLEETAATIEEITSTVKQTAENSQRASQISLEAVSVADAGASTSEETKNAMEEISNSSKKIFEIVGLVEEIAFQTNILAINAAIEAAKAGEQGKGFAVVAIEVRDLAQRSADAAKDIKQLIDTSIAKVENGENLVNQNSQKLKDISSRVKNVANLMVEISAAAKEQYSAIEQINLAVTSLDSTTQQNATLVDELTSAGENMEKEADIVKSVILKNF